MMMSHSACQLWGCRDALLSAHALLVVFCMLAMCAQLSDAAAAVDVYRLVQYDLSGAPFGSRRASLNVFAASSAYAMSDADLARAVIILKATEVDFSFLDDIIQGKKLVGGLLLVLPSSLRSDSSAQSDEDEDEDGDGSKKLPGLSESEVSALVVLEQQLIHSSIVAPVYFAFDSPALSALTREVQLADEQGKPGSATSGGFKLIVSVSEAKRLPAVTLPTIQGWLYGSKREGDSSALPTIAIVANYDTFSAAPALPSGANSNASGVAALLELLRLFSRLFSDAAERPSYNLLFALTPFGPFNFDGTKQWLASQDQRLLESIEFATCLNSIGSWENSASLSLHASRPLKDPILKAIYERLESSAASLGISLQFVHKKINISDSRVAWEHEHFSRSRVLAASISAADGPASLFKSAGGIADTGSLVSTDDVIKTVSFLGEALGAHAFGLNQSESSVRIFAPSTSLAPSAAFVAHWLSFLSQSPRTASVLAQKSSQPLISALEKEMAAHASNVELKHAKLSDSFGLYGNDKAVLNIYEVASITFDLLAMFLVASYLSALFVILFIATKGLDDFLGVFNTPTNRKSKTN